MVSQTRFWNCTGAKFVITRPILSQEEKTIDLLRELDIRPEDPIVIHLGYTAAPFTDKPFDPLDRVFFGYVDTINVKQSAKGFKVTINCRDSMRFLLDNKFSGQIFDQNYHLFSTTGFDDRRSKAQPLTLKEVGDALGVPDFHRGNMGLQKHFLIAWLIYAGSNGGSLPGQFLGDPRNSNKPTVDLNRYEGSGIEPSRRVISAPSDMLQGIQGFNIMNRFPLEVIKHIGSLEAEPRELYADITDGKISWRKRRTYNRDNPRIYTFLKPSPEGVQPNVISAETDWSTIGTISELVVINPMSSANSSNSSLPGSGVLTVSGRLPDDRFFKEHIGKAFPGLRHFTRRTRYIFDDTIRPEDLANAQGLIDAMFRIWGKDMRAGTIVVPGDQTMRPGQALKAYNFGYFNGQVFRAEAVIHAMTATGPNAGYRTSIAFAETDEDREDIIIDTKRTIQQYYHDFKNDGPGGKRPVITQLGSGT